MKKIENIIKQGLPVAVRVRHGWLTEKDTEPKDGENIDLVKALNGKYKKQLIEAEMETPFIELKDFITFLKGSKHKLKAVGMRSANSGMLGTYICIKNGEEVTYLLSHPKESIETFMQVYLECKEPIDFNQDTEFIITRLFTHVEATFFMYFNDIN